MVVPLFFYDFEDGENLLQILGYGRWLLEGDKKKMCKCVLDLRCRSTKVSPAGKGKVQKEKKKNKMDVKLKRGM